MKCIYKVDVSFDAVNGQAVNYRDVAMLRRVLWSVATATQQRDNCSTAAMPGVNISHGLQHAEGERGCVMSLILSGSFQSACHTRRQTVNIFWMKSFWFGYSSWFGKIWCYATIPRAGSKKQIHPKIVKFILFCREECRDINFHYFYYLGKKGFGNKYTHYDFLEWTN